ncbi:MAG: protein kinase [Elusimicrobia bacterium]|nr:protein kinase [Elusimicrobiota bacterium]
MRALLACAFLALAAASLRVDAKEDKGGVTPTATAGQGTRTTTAAQAAGGGSNTTGSVGRAGTAGQTGGSGPATQTSAGSAGSPPAAGGDPAEMIRYVKGTLIQQSANNPALLQQIGMLEQLEKMVQAGQVNPAQLQGILGAGGAGLNPQFLQSALQPKAMPGQGGTTGQTPDALPPAMRPPGDFGPGIEGRIVAPPPWQAPSRSNKPKRDPRELLLESSQKVDADPADLEALTDKAEALNELGDFAAAEAQANRALALNPRLVRALNARAFAYNRRGQYSLALQDSDLALSIEPGNAMAHLNRAMALEGLGRAKEALLEFETAARLDPAFMVIYREAVQRHGIGGRPAEASAQPAPERRLDPLRDVLPWLVVLGAGLGLWKAFASKTAAGPPAATADAPAAPPVPEGIIAGSYRLDRQLGAGGMGIVFEATDIVLRRRVAIKKLRHELRQTSEEEEGLLAEARLVAGLKHPNIVEIYAVLQESGEFYLVFELVAGKPLDKLLAAKGRLGLPEALHILGQLAAGLDYAHSKNIIHRDLKPANILISNEGAAKISDFGIAHRAKMTSSPYTQAGAWGTPHYMPPEQEMGSVTLESDIYALGAMTYELLTGVRPFMGPDFSEQKRSMRHAPASARVQELPPHVDGALSRALHVAPEQRFHSGAEFVRALQLGA